jgi:hypothetical protein
MANVKISELTALTPPAAADLVPVTDSSASQTKRTTVGEIVGIINGDVDVANDGAATISELPVSKLQDGAARQLLQTDAAGTGVEWTDDVDIPGTLDVTGIATLDGALNATGLASLDGGIDVDGAFTVADATGNVSTSGTLDVTGQSTLSSAAVSDLTSGRVVLAGTSGELEDNAGLTFNGTQLDVDGDVVITGDLTVEGTTTTIESETLTVKDKNIELGVVASPTDVTADGGGITLKGATDKTINWIDSTDAWTLSEHVSIASAKEYRINGTKVLDATSLGSAVVSSSLTSVGTIGTGVWNGTAIATAYIADSAITSAKIADDAIVNADINASAAIADTKLGTISTAGKVSNSATTAADTNTASAIVARDGSGNFSASTITAALTGNADTATALSSSRTFAVTGDVTGTVSSDLTSGASIATSIASGVIVDGDVNASAAIAGTKISPDFGSQAVTTTGLISADGITFNGDTAAANQLDDYEEGNWTPGNLDADFTVFVARYIKIGRLVHAWFVTINSNTSNTYDLPNNVQGLPYVRTMANPYANYGLLAGTVSVINTVTYTGSQIVWNGVVTGGYNDSDGCRIKWKNDTTQSPSNLQPQIVNAPTGGIYFDFHVVYESAS